MTLRRLAFALLPCVLFGTFASPASAAPRDGTSEASAATLFDEARRLADAGKLDVACAKFRASYDLDPRLTTQINVALCEEKRGALASAWAGFKAAAARAARESRTDLANLATAHANDLDPRVPRLTLIEDGAATTVTMDEHPLDRAVFGTALAVDPGRHRIDASAQGRVSWSTDVVAEPGKSLTVHIPDLAPAAPATTARTTGPTATDAVGFTSSQGLSPLTIAVVGASVVAAGVGTYFGLAAIGSRHDAEQACTVVSCGAAAQDKNDTARTQAWISTGAFATAIAAGALGTFFVLRDHASSANSKSARAAPIQWAAGVTPTGVFSGISGRW